MTTVKPEIRSEVELVQRNDRDFGSYQERLLARMRAVIESQQAMATGELGARWNFRQALVDLAAVSELIADDLPAPGSFDQAARPGH